MGCYGWYLEFCKQIAGQPEISMNYSDSNIVIDLRKNKREKNDFLNLNGQKQINENINFNNSNIAIKDKNNRQKYKHEIKNIEREKNNSLNSDSEEQQNLIKKEMSIDIILSLILDKKLLLNTIIGLLQLLYLEE